MKLDLEENELIVKKVQSVLVVIALLFSFAACDKPGPAEKAGQEIDNAVEKAGDKIEDATDEAGDKLEDAGDKIEDSTDK